MKASLAPHECVIARDGWCMRHDHHHDKPVVDMARIREVLRRLNTSPPTPRANGGKVAP